MFTLLALIIGFGLGIYSLTQPRTFVLILFGVLPVAAYFSGHFVDIDPHYSMSDHKSVWGNIGGLIGEIPDEYRLGAILFLPAIIVGRTCWVFYEAKRQNAIMDPAALNRKKNRIRDSYNLQDWE